MKTWICMGAAVALTGCASAQKAWNEEKNVTVPECSVAFSSQTEGTGYSNRFSNKGISSSSVIYTPFDTNGADFQEIADESCARLEKKIAALGYTVLTGPDLATKSEKYAELRKEQFTKEPDQRDTWRHFGSTKTGVPKGGMGFSVGMGYASIARNAGGVLLQPTFAVSFGSVAGGGSAVTDANGMTTSTASTMYNPEIVIDKNYSTMSWMTKDQSGHIGLSGNLTDASQAWLVTIGEGDTKTSALSVVGNLALGSRVEKSTYYTMQVDPAKMKAAILAQLDKAEDDYIAQIKKIKGL